MLRKSFFVKPKLLFKYVFYALLTVVVTSVCVFLVMRLTISGEILETLSVGEVEKVQDALMVSFWWIVLILLVIIAIQSLLRFHRIVGPVYALEKVVDLMKEGHVGGHIYLRRGDELKDLAKKVEEMSNNLAKFISEDKKKIEGVIIKLESLKGKIEPKFQKEVEDIKATMLTVSSNFRLSHE